MRLGAYFLPVDFPVYLRSVEAAEAAGYATAWVPDSQMIWQDPYVYMARGLAATERLVFGTAVTNAITRHFTVTASGHVTLAQMHPGRVVLGIGRGDSSIRTLGLRPLKVREMHDVVSRLRALMAGEAVDLDGEQIRITFAADRVPLMVGGTGPRSLRMAGALADLVTVEVGVNEDAVRWAVENIRRGAADAGRDPNEVQVVVLCAMWVSDDRAEARANCRWAPASAANHIAEVMHNNPEHGMPAALTRVAALRRDAGVAYDYYGGHCVNDADHARWIADEVIDDFTLAGPADEVVERIGRLAALGVDEVAAAFLGGEEEQMAHVGAHVIARLAAAPAG